MPIPRRNTMLETELTVLETAHTYFNESYDLLEIDNGMR
jgi:hypothetical protein